MSKIIVALDYDSEEAALTFISKIRPEQCKLKVGKAMFTRLGPVFIKKLVDRGFDIFLDLKFHDIPQQVAGACKAAADLGVWMVNVHASGGSNMLQAARKAIDESSHKPILLAVTLLTSLDSTDLLKIGIKITTKEYVLQLAELACQARLDGVVCSAAEASLLRKNFSEDFILVTPGIRLESSDVGDQKRIVTPEKAIANGVNYLVIGRPITQAEDPVTVLEKINHSIA